MDGGLPPDVDKIIGPFLHRSAGDCIVSEAVELDPLAKMVTDLFGFKAGEKRSVYAGLNEYVMSRAKYTRERSLALQCNHKNMCFLVGG